MAWTRYQLILAVLMVFTGSLNTIITKWADSMESRSRDGVVRKFHHPFFQATCMFIGEFLCFVLFKLLYLVFSKRADGSEDVNELTKGNRDFNPLILLIPAMCDMTATSVMYIGLNLTYASSYQMFRGAVIIFVGTLSVVFLRRVLKKREWSGIFMVIVGLTIVGVADFVADTEHSHHTKSDIIIGDILIFIAQILAATQMVVEEKYVAGLDIPSLHAVGWEGIFGFAVLSSLHIPFYFIKVGPPFSNNPRDVLEDAIDAFVQIGNKLEIIFLLLGMIVSIAFFNFAGISITKELSATTRMVLDSVRTVVIWAVSLMFMGQSFHWLQLLGFIILLFGMCLYNGVITFSCIKHSDADQTAATE